MHHNNILFTFSKVLWQKEGRARRSSAVNDQGPEMELSLFAEGIKLKSVYFVPVLPPNLISFI